MPRDREIKIGVRLALRVLCILLCGIATVACVSAIGATFARLGGLLAGFAPY